MQYAVLFSFDDDSGVYRITPCVDEREARRLYLSSEPTLADEVVELVTLDSTGAPSRTLERKKTPAWRVLLTQFMRDGVWSEYPSGFTKDERVLLEMFADLDAPREAYAAAIDLGILPEIVLEDGTRVYVGIRFGELFLATGDRIPGPPCEGPMARIRKMEEERSI